MCDFMMIFVWFGLNQHCHAISTVEKMHIEYTPSITFVLLQLENLVQSYFQSGDMLIEKKPDKFIHYHIVNGLIDLHTKLEIQSLGT